MLAQYFTISGKITDNNNQGLPFSSVQVKGTTQGTNANSEGFYSLKLAAGSYELIFQYIGYKKKVEIIAPRDRDQTLSALYQDVNTSRNGRDSFYFWVINKCL